MVNDSSMGRVGQSVRDIKEYAALRVEGFRLSLIENLATLFNSLFSYLCLKCIGWNRHYLFCDRSDLVVGFGIGIGFTGCHFNGRVISPFSPHCLSVTEKIDYQPIGATTQRNGRQYESKTF